MAHHYYHIKLRGTKVAFAYPVEGLDTCDDLVKQWEKPVEYLIPIPLADGNPECIVWLGPNLDQVTKNQLISFLHENIDVCTWTPVDMPGIDPLVMVYQLNIDPKH